MGSGTTRLEGNTGTVFERTQSGIFTQKISNTTNQSTEIAELAAPELVVPGLVREVVIKQEKHDESLGDLYSHLLCPDTNRETDASAAYDEMSWNGSPASAKHPLNPLDPLNPPTPSPSSKKVRRDTGVQEHIQLLSSMRWVHPTMKEDLEKAFLGPDKQFNNACNFWF